MNIEEYLRGWIFFWGGEIERCTLTVWITKLLSLWLQIINSTFFSR